MNKLIPFFAFSVLLLVPMGAQNAFAILIDLNDFFADPTTTIAPDGSSSFTTEDASFSEAGLSLFPSLGDPDVIVAAPGRTLEFNFDFFEGVGEDDEFRALLFDDSGGSPSIVDQLVFGGTSSGTASFNLDPFIGITLGLDFVLVSNPGDSGLTSTLSISNVQLVDPPNGNGDDDNGNGDGKMVGGEIIPIEITSLLLANTQSISWMIPLVLSAVGFGLLAIRRTENS